VVYFIEMKVNINSDDDMRALGARLACNLSGGECIQLIGDIGAGKTTLTKGIAAGLGITETVQSPTFTINRTYDTPSGLRLSHYDFYRLSDPGIMAAELDESIHEPNTVIVIEWGEVVADVMPDDRLTISITSPTETMRELEFIAVGDVSAKIVEALR
jgi:tRNA threonylcarbamoyladenosine biosynthesis protein TsaE